MKHKERKHSKFSASGASRWFNCPGSVELSEGLPDKSSPWAEEGTKAHEMLESILKAAIAGEPGVPRKLDSMYHHGQDAADFICKIARREKAEILVETRIYLDFIHPEMFGTLDSAILDHFGTLHVFDYKYGAGHAVSPKENLQMIFYGIGLAHKYDWNFKSVKLWIIQPRIKGYDGPVYWEVSIKDLKGYVEQFKLGVRRVADWPYQYVEGSWCHWCKAKSICPVKLKAKQEEFKGIFKKVTKNEIEKESEKTEEDFF